ncbi:peptidoglycan-binding protein [Candidatus Parcubacteria bacterium]|nr:peptidoglycan-binding protein [Candidatus Parcubacteria bacterium]
MLAISVGPGRAIAAADPIMWLKFDDGSGTTPQDSGANNIDGSFTATEPTWTNNVPSVSFDNPYALSFTGSGDAVNVSWPVGRNFAATDPRSFSFWYKPTANGEGSYSRIISWSSDKLEIAGTEAGPTTHKITYFDGNWHATDITLSLGTWYHVTFTYDGTTAKFYIGNELQDEHSLAGRDLSGTLRIGNRVQQLDEGINGYIDDVRVYDYALNSTQVGNLSSGSSNPDAAPDATSPSVEITVPASAATIGGSAVTLTASSSDNVLVSGVKFYYDSTNQIGSEITATTSVNIYNSTFNTTALSDGSHTLIAVARDAAGNRATSTAVTVTVDNTGPTISAVASSSITSSGGTLTWTTSEAASTKAVYSADSLYASSTTETDTSTRVTSHSKAISSLLSCTLYNYKVISADTAGNYATSTAGTFTTTGCTGGSAPSSSTSTVVTVSSAATSTVTDTGRTITVSTPANFTSTSSSVVIQIKGLSSSAVLDTTGKPSSSLSSAASLVFNVTALINNTTELDSFDTAVTVSYTYTDGDVSSLDESTLKMYHYKNSTWSELDSCSVNTGTNTITCTAPHFSIFAIFGTSQSSSSSSSTTHTGVVIGCTDRAALNFSPYAFGVNTALCQYARQAAAVSTAAPLPPAFTRDLRRGMSGEDVKRLQQWLNARGHVVSKSGPGSRGKETAYFGSATAKALAAFQKKSKIKPSSGYFGPVTRGIVAGSMR